MFVKTQNVKANGDQSVNFEMNTQLNKHLSLFQNTGKETSVQQRNIKYKASFVYILRSACFIWSLV